MSGIFLILFLLGVLGFLPLAIILYKRSLAKKILTTGTQAKARVYRVYTTSRNPADYVSYTFYDQHKQQFTGAMTTEVGLYKEGDIIDISYLPGNPKRNTVEGAWKSKALIVFGIVIAAFILFAVYKLSEMVRSGAM